MVVLPALLWGPAAQVTAPAHPWCQRHQLRSSPWVFHQTQRFEREFRVDSTDSVLSTPQTKASV